MQVQISSQLLLCGALAVGLAAYLAANLKEMPGRRFIGLSALLGVLVVLTIGGAFRTQLIGWLLRIPTKGSLAEPILSRIKAVVALTAALLSVIEALRRREKKPFFSHHTKGIAALLAVVSIGCYYRFGDIGYENFYHRWEFYHYYLGAKYDREVGYDRLYMCTAIAQAENGPIGEVKSRKLRDLRVDLLQPSQEVLDHPEECKQRFTPERWTAYKKDVDWFRHSSNIQYWNDMQKDHGYNPPPVWTVAGHFLASLHPASDGFFKLLALFDPLFFAGLFVAIYWAFRWRVLTVALVFWGCQLPAEYFWTGGAFLRQDWLFWLVLSACFIRKRFYALGGAMFAYSTLLRVFPGLLIVGWVAQMGWDVYKHRRIRPAHLRLVAGGVAATVLLVGVSVAVTGSRSYPEFYHHIQVHNNTALTNNMGLSTLLSQSWEGRMKYTRDEKQLDPFKEWKQMRHDRLAAFFPFRIIVLGALLVGFFFVVRRMKSLWGAQALSLLWVVALVELTCYYYTMFILAAFLSRMRRGVEQIVLVTAGISQLLAIDNRRLSYYYDDRYVVQSVLFVGFAIALVAAFWPPKKAVAKTVTPAPSAEKTAA
jgi:hypothetical protein